jgi:tetratricopeptide (TPR) repeat protein
MALIFALLGSPGAGPEAAPEDDPEMDLPPFLRLILPALGVFIVVRILPSTGAEFFAERCRVLMSDWHFTTSPEVARQLRDLSERGLRYDQRNPELYYSLGQGFSNQADLDPDPAARENYRHQAISAFQKAIELAPHDVNYFLDCGAQLDAARRFTDSDPLFARALQLDPNSARVSNALGAHLEAQGKFADATERYHEAMRLGGGMLAQLGLDRIEEAQKAKGADAPPTPKLRF